LNISRAWRTKKSEKERVLVLQQQKFKTERVLQQQTAYNYGNATSADVIEL
jgi:hypothetical protein